MDGTQWIIFILLIQVIHFLGTWKLYVKAGRKAWRGNEYQQRVWKRQ